MSKESTQSSQHAPDITLIFAYYENPKMLELQWQQMSHYSEAIKKRIAVIIVDDGSPRSPAKDIPRPKGLPSTRVYRISVDIPWNQDAARNIGAYEANTPWLLMTDIDHVVPEKTLDGILTLEKDSSVVYSFGRIKFDSGEVREPHPNSYLMTKDLYWTIGGHDEDFGGIYGKDVLFRKRIHRMAREVALVELPLARVGNSLVPDAGTTTISRENTTLKRLWGIVLEWLKTLRLYRGVQTLKYPYERQV